MDNNTGKVEKLTLQGRLTIENTQKIYDQVKTSFNNLDYLKIYLSETSEIDLAFLQILYSLLAKAHRLGKKISVFINDPEVIWNLIVEAGFETHFRINIDPSGTDPQIEGIFDE